MTEDPKARAARRAGRTGQATARAAFVESRVGPFDRAALDTAMTELFAAIGIDLAALAAGLPMNDKLRWVPIGPSDVRAEDGVTYPRSTGRVRDIEVSDDGTRAYAATGKGGVWYTDTAGAMWAPVGGWANRTRTTGGMSNAQATGSLLVFFDPGGDVKKDFVMVGSGELAIWNRPARPVLGGVGVLAALGAAQNAGLGGDPWEKESGQSLMEGLGVFRLARRPGVAAGAVGPPADQVVAGTNAGLFLGTRRNALGGGTEFGWAAVPGLDTFLAWAPLKPIVTDVVWMPGGADGRIVVAVSKGLEQEGANTAALGSGVAYSDDLGVTWHWVTGLDPAALPVPIAGRMSLRRAGTTDRVYVLGDLQAAAAPTAASNVPTLWQIPAMSAATPTASTIAGVPLIWPWSGKTQRDYDQCIEVDADALGAGLDRIYLGGSWFSGPQIASIHCFDVSVGPALVPSTDISRKGPPPAGDGATTAGLIGNNVHPDVHVLKLTGVGRPKQLWVGCDGGVYMSTQAGRVNTFSSLSGGFASLEINFVANHPTSTHFMAGGAQDNGRNVRTGDQVWETVLSGDGGGMAFHPKQSQIILSQYTRSQWDVVPLSLAFDMDRFQGFPDREENLSAFYSGAATVASGSSGRVALGTNRVWLTDDLGVGLPNTWNVLPWPGGPVVSDPRPGGNDPAATQNKGVPNGAPLGPIVAGTGPLGRILTMKWSSKTDLLVLFDNGVVRWTQDTATKKWSTKLLVAPAGVTVSPDVLVPGPDPAKTTLTDIAPIPETQDFYLVTSGDTAVPAGDTCFFFDSASKAFQATNLRHQLDPPPPPVVTGPLDPALAAVVDPAEMTTVYVGTVTGVWKGERTAGAASHKWTPLVNGLPPAAVQDLTIWVDPADKTAKPRLLRAAMQSKGVWEVDLTADEPQRTYVRVHLRDDRRRLPTPLANPRKAPGSNERVDTSPDIMVRPAVPTTPPAWKLPAGAVLKAGNIIGALPYQLWTFQTAFRWIFPSVVADGQWNSVMDDLIRLHRKNLNQPAASIKPEIDKSLWDLVVVTRLNAQGHVAAAGDLAVYRAPWQTPAALTAVGNEPDLMERILFAGPRGTSRVFPEKNIVDVLIHHRDTRPLAPNDAFAILMFRDAPLAATLTSADLSAIPKFVGEVYDADKNNTALPAEPTDWHLVTAAGRGVHRLPVALDARMPRAVAIEVDLSQPPVKPAHSVMFLAFVGSSVDLGIRTPPPGLPAKPTVKDLTTSWPYAAARIVEINTPR